VVGKGKPCRALKYPITIWILNQREIVGALQNVKIKSNMTVMVNLDCEFDWIEKHLGD
jgi:hypothetical protein